MDAKGYFQHLKSYLNLDYYATLPNMHGELKLKEKIFTDDGEKNIEVKLLVDGEAFAIKLDKEPVKVKKNNDQRGNHLPLFHFLDDQGKPWSRRCDFIVFHLYKNKLKVYCFEFKYKSLPADSVVAQLKSSENWCKSLYSIINIYTSQKKRFKLTKYALTYCDEAKAAVYLDENNKYLAKDPSIRHYHYDEIDGMALHDLEHEAVETIG